ncbi:CD69 protein, partial [Origma solitaria]|nr:CD69 protein [Origma solitaria]
CPKGWIGYRGVCYYLSKDHRSWDRGQALCSELGASLAMPKDMDMMFLSCLSGNVDLWLGLRR